ncbi:MAG: acyl-CoA carboxylase subunit beta [Methanobacteriota archaeon]
MTKGGEEREHGIKDERRRIERGGPEKYRAALSEDGKLFVRDRLALFFPGGLDFEDGLFANNRAPELPADGMVTGAGLLDGRTVYVMANDYTVKAGSMAEKGVEKFLRVQERALRARKPILYLVDSSGARITDQAGFFANLRGIGKYFYYHSLLSGAIPQISVLYGPCVAGAPYTPVFCDVTIMVRGMSAMAIASPRMVEMVTGEVTDLPTLGGPEMHARESGSCHLIAENEEDAARLVWQVLSYLPDHCDAEPPRYESRPPARSPAEIAGLVPEDPNAPFDMRDLVLCLVDEDSVLELSPDWAPELITAWARLGGRVVGIVANNSKHKAGAIFPESADKAAEFIMKCDAFNIPLIYLCDTPGFMVGLDVERDGILKRGKRFIYATSIATVPKWCVVVRKAYGAGIYAMCGPAYEPEATLALPGAEIAVMGPEAAVNAVFRRHIERVPAGPEREKFIAEKREEYKRDIDIHVMADDLVVDHIVPPTELRDELIRRLEAASGKEMPLPRKKHGTVF